MSTDIKPVNRQAPHHAPDEPKAQFLAFRAEGHSVASASELVGCSERTGWRWWKRGREVARNQENGEIQDDWVRIVRRTQGVQHTILGVLEEYATVAENDNSYPLAVAAKLAAGKELLKHGLLTNVYAGTGTDKLQKELTPTVQAQNVLIVVNAQKPNDIVEGEVVDG